MGYRLYGTLQTSLKSNDKRLFFNSFKVSTQYRKKNTF